MRMSIGGTELNLNDKLCETYREKLLYDISENECILYAESYFEKPFNDIVKLYPVESIEKAIEKAIQMEIDL